MGPYKQNKQKYISYTNLVFKNDPMLLSIAVRSNCFMPTDLLIPETPRLCGIHTPNIS